jgi:hypothetical protein
MAHGKDTPHGSVAHALGIAPLQVGNGFGCQCGFGDKNTGNTTIFAAIALFSTGGMTVTNNIGTLASMAAVRFGNHRFIEYMRENH